mgnify:CR=1 FL=1
MKILSKDLQDNWLAVSSIFCTQNEEQYDRAVEVLNALIDEVSEKLNFQQSLKKALMQDLLTGKVRVNVDNKENAVA